MDSDGGIITPDGNTKEDWYTDNEGMVMNETAFPRRAVEACKDFVFQDDDCLIATFPKSGTVQ